MVKQINKKNTSNKYLGLSNADFKQAYGKSIDALGFLKTLTNIEIVEVKSSR
jgi:hypothetical protein